MQTATQLLGKAKLSLKAKSVYDSITANIKWYAGKSNEKPFGGRMYRVSCNNIFIQNCWGISKGDVLHHMKRSLGPAVLKQGLNIQQLA
jgi:xanthine dehydrogenase molybdopterin-binding subunit B